MRRVGRRRTTFRAATVGPAFRQTSLGTFRSLAAALVATFPFTRIGTPAIGTPRVAAPRPDIAIRSAVVIGSTVGIRSSVGIGTMMSIGTAIGLGTTSAEAEAFVPVGSSAGRTTVLAAGHGELAMFGGTNSRRRSAMLAFTMLALAALAVTPISIGVLAARFRPEGQMARRAGTPLGAMVR